MRAHETFVIQGERFLRGSATVPGIRSNNTKCVAAERS
jgi:hypothetical protein